MKYLEIATRLSFEEVPATCPTVADILGILADKYDIGEDDIEFARKAIARLATGKLRNALIDSNRLFLLTRADLRKLEKEFLPAPQIKTNRRQRK